MCLIGLGCAWADPNGAPKNKPEMKKEIQDFKLRFVAQEIGLRDDQRAAFTEAYSRQMAEEDALFRQVGEANRRLKEIPNPTDADYERVNAVLVETKAKSAALEKKYDEIYAKFLTPQQRFKLKDAEMQFRRKMEEMCQKKGCQKDGEAKRSHKKKKK